MSERQIPFDQFPESLQSGGLFKKAARLCEAAFSLRSHFGEGGSAKPGPARPQGIWRAERTAVREHDK